MSSSATSDTKIAYRHQIAQPWPHWPHPSETDAVGILFANEPAIDIYARLYHSRQETILRLQEQLQGRALAISSAEKSIAGNLGRIADLESQLQVARGQLAMTRNEPRNPRPQSAGVEIPEAAHGTGMLQVTTAAQIAEELDAAKADAAAWKYKFRRLEAESSSRKRGDRSKQSVLLSEVYQELEWAKSVVKQWKRKYDAVATRIGAGVSTEGELLRQERNEHDREVARLLEQLRMLEEENKDLNQENQTLDTALREEKNLLRKITAEIAVLKQQLVSLTWIPHHATCGR
jgi:hypothetical protein